jgi:hypothetical protein
MKTKVLVCLANSRKGTGSKCFAGYDMEEEAWIRPSGSGWNGAVLDSEETLLDGTLPNLLDLIEVPLTKPAPEPGQPENWPMGAGQWKRVGRLSPQKALALLEGIAETGPVLGNRGKGLTPPTMASLKASLAVIEPPSIEWQKTEGDALYALFEHSGRELKMKVSDPAWCDEFAEDDPGTYTWREEWKNFLILSVTLEPWHGWHTKLVAGVISLDI